MKQKLRGDQVLQLALVVLISLLSVGVRIGSVTCRLMCFNTWSPEGGTDVRGKLREVGSYIEEVDYECIKWGLRHQRYAVTA